MQCEPLETLTIQTKNRVTLFPNPFSSIIHISNPDKGALIFNLYDGAGRTILSNRLLEEENQINTTSLSTGMYWYEIQDQDVFIERGKLIKN